MDKTVFIDKLEVGTFMRSPKCTCIPGGKGTNVSRAVKALGRPTKAMVIVGGHPGAHVVEMIERQDGVECLPVWVASQTRTITTVLEEPIHRQTAFFEPGSRVTDDEAVQVKQTFQEAVAGAKVVTFNGTVCDPAISHLYRDLIPVAKQAGALTILDSHGAELTQGIDSVPYMVKPNVAEAEELLGHTLESDEAKWQAAKWFHEKGIKLFVLSLGAQGAIVSNGTDVFQVVPPAVREVNPVGSGDALVAGFAIGLMEGMSLEEMAVLACAAGTANAMSWDIGHFAPGQVAELAGQVQVRRIQ